MQPGWPAVLSGVSSSKDSLKRELHLPQLVARRRRGTPDVDGPFSRMGMAGWVLGVADELEPLDLDEDKGKMVRKHWALEWTKAIVIALILWFLLRTMLIQAFRIPSSSMENTLLVGDVLFVNKAVYGAIIPFAEHHLPAVRQPQRSDLVVFESPEIPGLHVVKRVVGVPGDTLSMAENQLWLNGTRVDEPYAVRSDTDVDTEDPRMRAWQTCCLVQRVVDSYRPTLRNWGPIVVSPDSVFVMGDNRDYSYDSRYWGFLGRDRIVGQPLFIYYSFDKESSHPLPPITAIRWSRLFSVPR